MSERVRQHFVEVLSDSETQAIVKFLARAPRTREDILSAFPHVDVADKAKRLEAIGLLRRESGLWHLQEARLRQLTKETIKLLDKAVARSKQPGPWRSRKEHASPVYVADLTGKQDAEKSDTLLKPSPCIGCGYCCKKSVCCVGQVHGAHSAPPCDFVRWDEDRYWCGVLLDRDPDDRVLLEHELAIGAGCCSSMNSFRLEMLRKKR